MSFPNVVHASEQAIYADDVTAKLPVGQKVELPNGRIFRYALCGATATIAGTLTESSARVGHADCDTLAIPTGSSVAIGDTTITITNGAQTWTADELKDGYLILERVEELGAHYFRIEGNTAETTGSSAMTITLTPGVEFDLALVAGTAVVQIGPNPWSKVVISPTAIVGIPTGGAIGIITATQYGYLQTGGLGSCKFDKTDTATVGEALSPGDNTTGDATSATSDVNLPVIAWMVQANSDTLDHTAVYWKIDC